jgi:hypothetical protein
MSSGGTRRGLRAFAGNQANAGSAALVYQAATGNELGGGAEGGSENNDGICFGHYDVATLRAPKQAVRTIRRDELLYKVQDAAIRGLPEQLDRLLQMEGTNAWPTTSGTRGVAVPLPLESLLEEKDTRGRTPLWLAVENAPVENPAASQKGVGVLTLLARKGANINATASVKLTQCEREIFDGLDTGGHKERVSGCSAFLLATRRGNLHVMRALQKLGADVQLADDDGRTPLCVAAASRSASSNATLQLLISMGVDLEQSDRLGLTPLASACACGNLYAACRLVEAGAQKMAPDHEGAPPFFQAVRFGHFDMLRPMLERWWSHDCWPSLLLDTVDRHGRTACHYAASRCEPDCIRALWDLAGCSGHDLLMRQDAMGQTPLNHACASHYVDYHRYYHNTGALRSVQSIVGLGTYSHRELSEAIVDLVRMDPAGGIQLPFLGRDYYCERRSIQSGQLEEAQGEEALSGRQMKHQSDGNNGTMWAALAERCTASTGLRHASTASPLSGRQLVRQWLEMVVVLPTEVRALVLCHQRLAWASVTHPRLSRLGQSTRNRSTQLSPAAALSVDLVGQVSESVPPEYRSFAAYAVCWRLLLDERLGWEPTVGACLQVPGSQ